MEQEVSQVKTSDFTIWALKSMMIIEALYHFLLSFTNIKQP